MSPVPGQPIVLANGAQTPRRPFLSKVNYVPSNVTGDVYDNMGGERSGATEMI